MARRTEPSMKCFLILILGLTSMPFTTKGLRIKSRGGTSQFNEGNPAIYDVSQEHLHKHKPELNHYELLNENPKTELTSHNYNYVDDVAVSVDASLKKGHRRRRIPQALRRRYAKAKSEERINNGDPINFPRKKIKGGRRRKLTRPRKAHKISSNSEDDSSSSDLGDSGKEGSNSSGDKNLAHEIGSQNGKYELIDKFFDDTPSKAPGIISYEPNIEFTEDNSNTLGNVPLQDVWLSEGHTLVLKGSSFNKHVKPQWKPIDDYDRTGKPPLKIPLDSDNPPPFPIFVNDSGPPVFLKEPPPFLPPYPPLSSFNGSFDPSNLPPPGLIPLNPNGTLPHFLPPPPFQNGSFPPLPFPPPGNFGNNSSPYGPPPPFPNGPYNGSYPPPPPPFLPPPGSNLTGGFPPGPLLPPFVLNPADNETDDPSIFLPPPYEFDYKDEEQRVKPGPFAPGLVVPPPKDFYTVYNKTSNAIRPFKEPSLAYGGPSSPPRKYSTRPNAKKPRFPLTTIKPNFLAKTTPYFNEIVTPNPKRRKNRVKSYKSYGGAGIYSKHNKLQNDAPSFQDSSIPSSTQKPKQYLSQKVYPKPKKRGRKTSIVARAPPVTHFTDASFQATVRPTKSTPTTPTPLKYFYERGKLVSFQDLSEEKGVSPAVFFESTKKSTSPAPYDAQGYPTRVTNLANLNRIKTVKQKTTTIAPLKVFYHSTPKLPPAYTHSSRKVSRQPKIYNYDQYDSNLQNHAKLSIKNGKSNTVRNYPTTPTAVAVTPSPVTNYRAAVLNHPSKLNPYQHPQQQQYNFYSSLSNYPVEDAKPRHPSLSGSTLLQNPPYNPTVKTTRIGKRIKTRVTERPQQYLSSVAPFQNNPTYHHHISQPVHIRTDALNGPKTYSNYDTRPLHDNRNNNNNNININYGTNTANKHDHINVNVNDRNPNTFRASFKSNEINSPFRPSYPRLSEQSKNKVTDIYSHHPTNENDNVQNYGIQRPSLSGGVGYYSPISQYHIPITPNPNKQSGIGVLAQGLSQSANYRTSNPPNQYPSRSYLTNSQAPAVGDYRQSRQPFPSYSQTSIVPTQTNPYAHYRERLVERNTARARSSDATNPPVPRAPSQDSQPRNENDNGSNYYTFKRGGPGGYSYSINL